MLLKSEIVSAKLRYVQLLSFNCIYIHANTYFNVGGAGSGNCVCGQFYVITHNKFIFQPSYLNKYKTVWF